MVVRDAIGVSDGVSDKKKILVGGMFPGKCFRRCCLDSKGQEARSQNLPQIQGPGATAGKNRSRTGVPSKCKGLDFRPTAMPGPKPGIFHVEKGLDPQPKIDNGKLLFQPCLTYGKRTNIITLWVRPTHLGLSCSEPARERNTEKGMCRRCLG